MYFNVPKCASSTIRKDIFTEGDSQSLRNPIHSLEKYFRFAFVRNPWDRLVSNWRMFTTFPGRIRQIRSMTDEDLSRFEDFVEFSARRSNHHWQPQVLFVPEELDFVGRVERFKEDIGRIRAATGLSLQVDPMRKRNSTSHKPYWLYYTEALVNRVGDLYEADISRFGYDFR